MVSHERLSEQLMIGQVAVDRILPRGWLVLFDGEVGVPGEAVTLHKNEEQCGDLEPLLGEEEHVSQQGQLIEGGQEVEELGPGLLVFAQVVGVEVIKDLEGVATGVQT